MRCLGIIPARGGSRGFPGKNLAPLAGLPLIGHTIRCAERCSSLGRTIVSTDDPEIAEVARSLGADVPFLRPAALALDETPVWSVLRHAIVAAGGEWDAVVLLQPTSPLRLPEDVDRACALLAARGDVDGVVSASEPPFNPVWQCVVEENGVMRHLLSEGELFHRRQDAPRVLRLDGLVYAWRSRFVQSNAASWFEGRNALVETDARRAVDVDTEHDLRVCAALLAAGVAALPWLD